MNNTHRDHNYRIATDTLDSGKVRAKARGRKTNAQTFPAGTTHEDAATKLAAKIGGPRFAHVKELTSNPNGSSRDFAIFVTF
jgi:hypothetical protein